MDDCHGPFAQSAAGAAVQKDQGKQSWMQRLDDRITASKVCI
jgi:hypothetical protein